MQARKLKSRQRWCNGFVAFVDTPGGEQCLISRAGLPVG
ncbi:hypothetical protein APX70_200583 [Pseudomonas syringae pv. maculicola]|uniref:Uncharacterized protein n=1 Tax=Pseudomonas syringae pv. maculicola TaxID=59511 RepID=A0A3M2UD88_PSEYM|nr:hypothetical protein APX70_200583 [Pseudomonas syringae pv. maculicola]